MKDHSYSLLYPIGNIPKHLNIGYWLFQNAINTGQPHPVIKQSTQHAGELINTFDEFKLELFAMVINCFALI